jgi:tetratricopeptide (TPR) repeat protein
VLGASRRILGDENPETMSRMELLARLYKDQGKCAQAEEMYTKVLEFDRRILGEHHASTMNTLYYDASLFWLEAKYDKAEVLYTQSLEASRSVLGEDHPITLSTSTRLAEFYEDRGMHTKAESLVTKAVEAGRKRLGVNSPTVQDSLAVLGLVRMGQMKYVEAEPLLRQTLADCKKTGHDDWRRFRAESVLGGCLFGQKKYSDSEPLLLSGYRGLKERESTMPALQKKRITEARARVVRLYDAWGKSNQATAWRNGSE